MRLMTSNYLARAACERNRGGGEQGSSGEETVAAVGNERTPAAVVRGEMRARGGRSGERALSVSDRDLFRGKTGKS